MPLAARRLTHRSRALPLALVLATAAGSWPAPAVHAQSATVRCESKDGQRVTCPADTSQGVMLSKQLSTEGCWKDETWGTDANGVWVSDRCRAEFAVAAAPVRPQAPAETRGEERQDEGGGGAGKTIAIVGGIAAAAVVTGLIVKGNDDDDDDRGWLGGNGWGNGDNRIVRCESRKDKRRTCATRKGADVEMRRQLSDRPCNRGSSWGKSKEYIWVDHGCRAEFWVRD